MMMFRREVNLPADVVFPFPNKHSTQDAHQYVNELRTKMEECFQITRNHLKTTALRQKRDYNSRIIEQKV
jgi:hypothetical protein